MIILDEQASFEVDDVLDELESSVPLIEIILQANIFAIL